MGDRLPLVGNERRRPGSAASSGSAASGGGNATAAGGQYHSYEELMHGHIPCPSCRGAGRIPKELESRLVALIPVDDARLKPRRTWLFVLIGVAVAVLAFGLVGFFLAPRSVTLSAASDVIAQVMVLDYVAKDHVTIRFENTLLVHNENYFAVTVVNTTSLVINKFQPFTEEVIGRGSNSTSIVVAPRADGDRITVNNVMKLDGAAFQFCDGALSHDWPLYMPVNIEMTVNVEYFGHVEQDTVRAKQQVCCLATGNCTMLEV